MSIEEIDLLFRRKGIDMFSLNLRILMFLVITSILIGCSRSHIPLQFEGAEPYYGGLAHVDAVIESFNQLYSFDHTKVYIFDIGRIAPRLEDGSFNTQHAATVATDRLYAFYYVRLAEHGNYAFVDQDRSKYSNFIVDISLLNRDQELERKIYAQLIDEDFVIIDAY